MKRLLWLLALVAAASGAVGLMARADRDQQYHRLLAEGEAANRDGNGWLAIEAFSGALVLRPDSMVAYYRRGLAYRSQGHDQQAIRDWKDAHALNPDAPEPLVALAELYDTRDEPEMAAAHYALAADLLKDEDPGLLYALALARYRSGAIAEAVDPLRRAVARNAELAGAHHLLGLVYRDIGDPTAAIASLDRAIQIDRKLIAPREELADIYRTLGRHADEVLQLQALAQLEPQIDRRVAVVLARARGGEFAAALEALAAVATDAPNDSRVHLALGRVHLARAEATADPVSIRRAREALELALGGTARRSEGLALYGRALHLSGDHDEALRILQDAVATSPADRQAFAYLAETAEALARDILARDALLSLQALLGSTSPHAETTTRARRIGVLSLRGGDVATAARYLRRAVNDGLNDASTLASLAEAQWGLGEFDAARVTLDAARTQEARDPDVLRVGRVVR